MAAGVGRIILGSARGEGLAEARTRHGIERVNVDEGKRSELFDQGTSAQFDAQGDGLAMEAILEFSSPLIDGVWTGGEDAVLDDICGRIVKSESVFGRGPVDPDESGVRK